MVSDGNSCAVEVLWYKKFVASSGRPSVGRVKTNEIVDIELIN